MSARLSFEKQCTQVACMSKSEIVKRLLHFDGPIKLDFTRDFLETLSLDKLRHIMLAAIITADKKQTL